MQPGGAATAFDVIWGGFVFVFVRGKTTTLTKMHVVLVKSR
jgi:hypothetical protein